MEKKGYGNVRPRFAKYFARHKSSAGAHDPKNAKQAAEEKTGKASILYPCPICQEPLGERIVFNPIIGSVCSTECLEEYWRGNQEDRDNG